DDRLAQERAGAFTQPQAGEFGRRLLTVANRLPENGLHIGLRQRQSFDFARLTGEGGGIGRLGIVDGGEDAAEHGDVFRVLRLHRLGQIAAHPRLEPRCGIFGHAQGSALQGSIALYYSMILPYKRIKENDKDRLAVSNPLLTVQQAAQQLRLHPKTVLRYIKDGKLRATRIGKGYRIARADLDALAGLDAPSAPVGSGARATCMVDVTEISA